MYIKPIIIAFVVSISAENAAASGEELLSRGEYILRIGGCVHCHTADGGEQLAGGRPLETPFGTFYTPNITPHDTAGIGAWSESQFRDALHSGVAPDGESYYPAFPYTSYTRIVTEDVRALWAYLKSLPASSQPNREHELPWYLQFRIAAQIWQYLFFTAGEYRERPQQSVSWNRGAYIAEALAHCGECHTPRSIFGATQADLAYAGTAHGPDDEQVPNITPHPKTGIGDWTRDELRQFLEFGELPDGEYAAGAMEPVSEELTRLTAADREALVDYLQALTPVDNAVGGD
ncbi:MAG: cytochrome c [Gammaproteobacteria bacterium]|nr:cytochrome c [Gammaproteobacteria bacterium]